MSILITSEIFIKRAKEKHGDKYDYSKVEYVKQNEKVVLICPLHGEFLMEPRNHLRSNSGCDKCKSNVRLTNEAFIDKARLLYGDKYDYSLIDYKNKYSILTIVCPTHGEFKQEARFHSAGHGCQKCGKIISGNVTRLTTKEYITNMLEIHGDKYDYSKVIYTNNKNKVSIICPLHGEFNQVAQTHSKGSGCKKCKESRGERVIREFLIKNNIDFISEYKFPDCKNKLPLPFDFYLPELNICIEFNGAQHYKPVKYWGGEVVLKKVKFRDKIKKEYCKLNNIPLIIIRYNEDLLKKMNKLINIEP